MHDAASFGVRLPGTQTESSRKRAHRPYAGEIALALFSALLLVLSFPNFDFWFLAWFSLVPLFIVLAKRPCGRSAFVLGWLWGVLFFYGTCYWLTYSMIRYGHLSAWLAYSLLIIPAALVALFPAATCLALARLLGRWGVIALLAAPFLWVSCEWSRLWLTGQLWNAIGYSQAYVPFLIRPARWGGVYAVSFLIVLFNAALAYVLAGRKRLTFVFGAMILLATVALTVTPAIRSRTDITSADADVVVIAIQPNVPMEPVSDPAITDALLKRHTSLSITALDKWEQNGQFDNAAGRSLEAAKSSGDTSAHRAATARLVIWPESPMNFAYGNDRQLRDLVADFAKTNRTSLILNSLESAPAGGDYNSALLINEEGVLVAQYDKIRLMPFGEYVPLPRWLPGAKAIAPLVGGFTAGTKFQVMPVGQTRAGVFICFESAFPYIARTFTNEGASLLINISNDGYLGPTPVMRQHLANAIFRAVENNRPVMRVTNTGLTAYITGDGEVRDVSGGFQPLARIWAAKGIAHRTFYTKYGDLFVGFCVLVTLIALAASIVTKKPAGAGSSEISRVQ